MLLQDAFICFIWREFPIKPLVIFSKCRRSIIGCEHYINRWYSGEDVTTKMCPKCRAERGYAETVRVTGLDEFLEGVHKLMNEGAADTTE